MRERHEYESIKGAWRTFDFRSKIRRAADRARTQIGSLSADVDLPVSERRVATKREALRRRE
jgi:hypothetical protein